MVESNTNEKVDIYKSAIKDLLKDLLDDTNITFFDENLTGLNSLNPQDKKKFLIEHAEKLFKKSFWDWDKTERNYKSDINGDSNTISKSVYWILWGDKLQELENPKYNYYDFKYENDFSGDSICTFNTLFSSDSIMWFERNNIPLFSVKHYEHLQCFSFTELTEINDFRLLYQTLGNFYILPKRKFGGYTINTYRGSYKDNGWKDYFDTFLSNLDNTLQTNYKENNQDEFSKLLNINSFFFDKYKTLGSFLTLFYLQDFEYYQIDNKHLRSCDYNKNNPEEYKSFALDYIRKSTKCIEKRADKLQEAFVEKLENMDESNFK